MRVVLPTGEERVPVAELSRAIAEHGGPLPAAPGARASAGAPSRAPIVETALPLEAAAPIDLRREAAVIRSRSVAEEPVHYQNALLGYAERQGKGEAGTLRLEGGEVLFHAEGTAGAEPERWPLLDIRALQSSSSLVQLSLQGGALIQFRFRSDSPRRWEELLRIALQQAWTKAGRGEIVEFQPRIVVR